MLLQQCAELAHEIFGFFLDLDIAVAHDAERAAAAQLEAGEEPFEAEQQPREIDEALPRHRIWGMYLAMFQASDGPEVVPPTAANMALVGTHDTPTFAGWLKGEDIADRVRYGLLSPAAVPEVTEERARAAGWLAAQVGATVGDPPGFLADLLAWLGRSESPLVVPWFEDLWLEEVAVNLPGTPSSVRPNWQRPLRRLLEGIFTDPEVDRALRHLHRARNSEAGVAPLAHS